MREQSPPIYFEHDDRNYMEGADETFEGKLWRRDGVAVSVRCVHKTFSHYFEALKCSGFNKLPSFRELAVTKEHWDLDPDFFGPLKGYPLHILFKVKVND
ncbi:hypothetical protein [Microbulbifer epialgicus]|uniref:ASCH domain-containing protein n=1 Tax=Microbulbifer epialgicus TaxID=393907 RepID=A0ABV4P6W5_9GAMM